jgi:hypothetical protein
MDIFPSFVDQRTPVIYMLASLQQLNQNTNFIVQGRCGWDKGSTCLGSSFGECCSASGWCGNTTDYCLLQDGCNVGGINNPYLGVCLG